MNRRGVFSLMSLMFRHFRISLFIPLLLVFLTGCVDIQGAGDQPIGAPGRVSALPPAPARPDGRLRADIESLGKNLSALRRGLANQEGRIEKVRKALQSLTDRIEKNRAGGCTPDQTGFSMTSSMTLCWMEIMYGLPWRAARLDFSGIALIALTR